MAVLASLLALEPVSGPAGAAGANAVGCGADRLVVSWRGTTGGLAGSFGDLEWVTNTGTTPCTLRGYPVVRFEAGAHRAALLETRDRGFAGNDSFGVAPRHRIPSVRIAPGGRASFWLFGTDVMTPCPDLTSMVVALPGTWGTATLGPPRGFTEWNYCGRGFVANPIVAGVSGSLPPQPLRGLLET